MTTSETIESHYVTAHAHLSDDELLAEMEHIGAILEGFQNTLGHLEQEAYRRIEERGSTSIPSEVYECKIEIKNEFDYPAFRALKEVFNPSDFAECLIPEHTIETVVEEKWVTSTVKRLCREYGAETQAIYDRATIPGKRRLVFKRRDKK